MNLNFECFLDDDIETIEEGARMAVNQTLDDIAEEARATAPVLSGAYKESIYVAGDGEDAKEAHADAVERGRKVNPKAEFDSPASNDSFEEGMHFGVVAVAAAHGPYVENGSGGRAANPILQSAGSAMEDRFAGRGERIAAMLSSK